MPVLCHAVLSGDQETKGWRTVAAWCLNKMQISRRASDHQIQGLQQPHTFTSGLEWAEMDSGLYWKIIQDDCKIPLLIGQAIQCLGINKPTVWSDLWGQWFREEDNLLKQAGRWIRRLVCSWLFNPVKMSHSIKCRSMPTLFPHSRLITIMRLPPLMLSNDPLELPSARLTLCFQVKGQASLPPRCWNGSVWARPDTEDQQSLVRGQQCCTCCAFPLVLCFPLSIFSIKACLPLSDSK